MDDHPLLFQKNTQAPPHIPLVTPKTIPLVLQPLNPHSPPYPP